MIRFARITPWMLAWLLFACASVHAAVSQQSITLQPGWNAVFIELEPDEPDIRTVFSGLPIASVWRWRPDLDGAQFVRDPAEGLENIDGWFAWFPEPRPEAFLSNLFRIEGNTAYLIRLEGAQSRQITVHGRALFRTPRWATNAFTLTGLPVDPAAAPSFAEFFAPSAAHAGQPVYTLESDGRWRLVSAPASTPIQRGRAYWIYTRGNSKYQAPMHIVLDGGESLEFTAALEQIRIVLRNFSGAAGSFQIERVGNESMPLLYRNEDPETGEVGWPVLREALTVSATTGADAFVTLAVDRRNFEASRMEQTLAITDEQGTRVLITAGGNTIQPLAAARKAGAKGSEQRSMAGLWIGNLTIDKVSEAQQAGTTPLPTTRTFSQRVLIHVDGAGQARLLKDVIQMWENGTYRASPVNPQFREVDQPGRYVLLTDKNLIGLYSGATNRAGASVGIRYSTVGYDFEGEYLEMQGEFAPEHTLQAAIVVEPDLPTNPFLHRYHPDHNNLDEQFLNFKAEAYRVVRDVQFTFAAEGAEGQSGPGWGETRMAGRFDESIVGLHRNPIFVSGRFELRRVAATAVLNQ